jgi:hypothetical protein
MAEIGTAYVALLPSAKGIAASTSAELGAIGAPAGEQAATGFKGRFLKGLAGIGATMGAFFAIDKIKDFATESVGAAREFEKLTGVTAQVIKTTGGAAGVTAKQVEEMATAISKNTGFTDEQVISGENMLLTFRSIRNEAGKNNKIYDQATHSVVDLAAAMAGGGRGSAGANTKTAAIQLGKALNNPTKGVAALARVGIQFTDSQTEQIKKMQESGHLMGAQKLILRELHKEFGGAAAAGATAGDKLHATWGRLQVQLGTLLLPALDKIETVITEKVLPAVSKFIDQFKNDEGTPGKWRDAITDLWKAFQQLWPLLVNIGKWLADHVGLIEAVVAAYVAWQLAELAFNTVQSIQLVLLMAATPETLANAVATGIAATASAVWAAALWLVTTPLGLVVLGILALIVVVILIIKYHKQIGAFIVKVWTKIKDAIVAAWKGIKAWVVKTWTGIKQAIVHAVTDVVSWIKDHWKVLLSILGGPFVAAIIVIASHWKQIKAAISSALQATLGFVKTAWGKLTGIVRSVMNAVSSVVRAAWRGITGIVQAAGSALVNAVRSIPGKLLNLAGSFASAGHSIITAFVNGMKDASGIVSGIAGNVWNALKGLIDSAISHINAALEFTIHVGPKSFTINPPDIPPLATGGRARGSIVEVGDGSSWESIIPDKLMVQALTAAASSGAGAGAGTQLQVPDRLRLVVDGYEFNAYVDDRADRRVGSASQLAAERGRASWR